MKNLLSISFIFITLFVKSQDTIVTTKFDTTFCEITLNNEKTLFYEYTVNSKIESSHLNLDEIYSYSYKDKMNYLKKVIISPENLDKYNERYIYCELHALSIIINKTLDVSINYGELGSYLTKEALYKEVNGKRSFNSIVDGLNYMSAKGWKLVKVYTTNHTGYDNYHYLLKKSIIK